jgi:phage terminase large subunit-like protein
MPKKAEKKIDIEKPVLDYCKQIQSNKISSCLYVKKAIKRFLLDLNNDGWDYYFDWDCVQKFYEFTKQLKLIHSKEYLELLPWQLFVHANLLGWKNKYNNKQRFRSGTVFVPRKNGKTTGLMYPLLLWNFLTVNSSEAYFFEKDERQAEKIFRDLKTICKNSEGLNSIISDTGTKIYYKNSRISYFSSETIGIDGYNPSLAVIDEYFCFQSDRPVTAMRYGSRARDNGLVLIITTAGTDISLPAYNEAEKIKKILNGLLIDDTYFGIIYGIDDKDDWKKTESYIKANPSIDTIIDRKILEQDLQDALITPSHQPDYKAKTLNIWTNDTTNWIPLQKWDTEKRNTIININDFEGQVCYGGLDLSSINDFTAYTLCFKRDSLFYLFHKFYIPSEQIMEKYRVENIGIKDWVDKGIVIAIPGLTIDYDYIKNDIIKDAAKFKLVELAYDRWQSNKLIEALDEVIPNTVLIQYDQSLKQMSGPSREYEKLILEDKIIDANHVIKWMVSNAVIKIDINGNYKPLKEYKSSTKRIDGVITSIMAIDRANQNDSEIVNTDFNSILNLF